MKPPRDIEAFVRCKAFGRMAKWRVEVDADGTVRVFDDVAGHYTTLHGMSVAAQRRVRKYARGEL